MFDQEQYYNIMFDQEQNIMVDQELRTVLFSIKWVRALNTSNGARSMSSMTTQRPTVTACVNTPGCHLNSPGKSVPLGWKNRLEEYVGRIGWKNMFEE